MPMSIRNQAQTMGDGQTVVSKYHFPGEEPGLLGDTKDSKSRAGKIQDEL